MIQLTYKQVRLITAMYVALTTSAAITAHNFWLSLFGVVSGMLFLWQVKRRFKVRTSDERIENIAGKAARTTYAIMTIALAFFSLMLMFASQDAYYLKTLGITFSYLALTMIALYSLAYHYYARKVT